MVWPHRSTDVSLSESNMYCLATTAKVPNDEQAEASVSAEQKQEKKAHLVADGAVVLHRVLDAAVLVAQGRRVAGSCVVYNINNK